MKKGKKWKLMDSRTVNLYYSADLNFVSFVTPNAALFS